MRLKTFTAPSLREALAQVRRELGEDAVIVQAEEDKAAGARVVAAVEPAAEDGEDAAYADAVLFRPLPGREGHVAGRVAEALDEAGFPPDLAGRLTADARRSEARDAVLALAGAIDLRLPIRPLGGTGERRTVALLGPAGAGKTVTAAKLAARAALAGAKVALVGADAERAGGLAQLGQFARQIGLKLVEAADEAGLEAAARTAAGADLVLVDLPAANPFDPLGLAAAGRLAQAADAEPVAVLPAGMDAADAADHASAYSELGARRAIVTRIDASRRPGGTLYGLVRARLALAELGVAPQILDGLAVPNPMSLARLLLGMAGGPGAAARPDAKAGGGPI